MQGDDKDFLETDIRKAILQNLRDLGLEPDFVDVPEIEKYPYTSGHFSGVLGMSESLGIIKVKGQNFDFVHILRRG